MQKDITYLGEIAFQFTSIDKQGTTKLFLPSSIYSLNSSLFRDLKLVTITILTTDQIGWAKAHWSLPM